MFAKGTESELFAIVNFLTVDQVGEFTVFVDANAELAEARGILRSIVEKSPNGNGVSFSDSGTIAYFPNGSVVRLDVRCKK